EPQMNRAPPRTGRQAIFLGSTEPRAARPGKKKPAARVMLGLKLINRRSHCNPPFSELCRRTYGAKNVSRIKRLRFMSLDPSLVGQGGLASISGKEPPGASWGSLAVRPHWRCRANVWRARTSPSALVGRLTNRHREGKRMRGSHGNENQMHRRRSIARSRRQRDRNDYQAAGEHKGEARRLRRMEKRLP